MTEVHIQANSDVVTAFFRRQVVPGQEEVFLAWCNGISAASAKYEGYIGTNLINPTNNSLEYIAILKFDCFDNFRAWNDSDEHNEWLEKLEGMVVGEADWEIIEGISYWFGPSTGKKATWPPDFKMVVVAFVAIWPLVCLIRPLYEGYLPGPSLVRATVSTIIITGLMAYITLPLTSRIFNKWIFRKRA
ncbi:MAG: antibiotic biosynthesis monooxygenase [Pseudomonadales bacterium]